VARAESATLIGIQRKNIHQDSLVKDGYRKRCKKDSVPALSRHPIRNSAAAHERRTRQHAKPILGSCSSVTGPIIQGLKGRCPGANVLLTAVIYLRGSMEIGTAKPVIVLP
jgi:hypothetical protein